MIQNPQPIESNAAAIADQITSENNKSNDESSDLETAEFKHFGFRRKLGYGIPVAVPVAPVYVQPYIQPIQVQPVQIQPVHIQPVQYQHVHTPDCGCNGGGYQQGGHSYGYNYNYHYNYWWWAN